MKKLLTIIFILSAVAGNLHAEVVTRLSSGKISLNQTVELKIAYKNDAFTINLNPAIDLGELEESEDFRIVSSYNNVSAVSLDGKTTSVNEIVLTLAPLKEGKLRIPPITIEGEKSKEMFIDVARVSTELAYGNEEQKATIFVKAAVDEEKPFERAQVIYVIRAYIPNGIEVASGHISKPQSPDAIIEPMDRNVKRYDSRIGDTDYTVFEQRFAIFPTRSGDVTIHGSHVNLFVVETISDEDKAKLQSANPFLDSFFKNAMESMIKPQKNILLRPESITLAVREPPKAFNRNQWHPALSLSAETDPADMSELAFDTGTPVNLNIRLKAEGMLAVHLPEIKLPQVEGLKIYPGNVKNENFFSQNAGSIKDTSFVLIPTRNGTFTLPEIQIPWFNLTTGQKEVLRIPAMEIHASGSVNENTGGTKGVAGTPLPSRTSNAPLLVLGGIVLGFAISTVAAVTTLAILKPRRRRNKNIYERSLKRVRDASRMDSPKVLQEALISWGQAHLSRGVTSLYRISDILRDNDLRAHFERLNRVIYSEGKEEFDGQEMYRTLERSLKTRRARLKKEKMNRKKKKLPKLYPF